MTTLIELADAYAEANRTFQSDVLGNIDRGDARAALVAGIEALQAENAGLRSECADYKRQWAEWSSSLDSVMKQRNELQAKVSELESRIGNLNDDFTYRLENVEALRAELDKLKAQEPVEQDQESERAAFEADAEPLGFDLLRMANPNVEPWGDYHEMETGMRWGGWLARAALAAPQAPAPQWQPIETAPKSEKVLLWATKHKPHAFIGYWDEYDAYNQPRITHWMPLPPSPVGEGK